MPSDQCLATKRAAERACGPALSRLRNIGQRQRRRHGIFLCHSGTEDLHQDTESRPSTTHRICPWLAPGQRFPQLLCPRLHADHSKSESPSARLGLHRVVHKVDKSTMASSQSGCLAALASGLPIPPWRSIPIYRPPFSYHFCCGGCADAQAARAGSGPVKDTDVSYGGGGGGVCTAVLVRVPLKQIAGGASNRLCPIVSPGPRDRRPPQPRQPCSVSRAPKPALDWQPVAERQRQRDLQEGPRRETPGQITHTFCSPPQISTMSRKGWEVPGELPVYVPVPPSFSE
ncbi:hypothetical protein B0T18DRAFT_223408 [Schizothecium vesticola]|uniref:Uncharacterized protein n=1 Tax=Schizothecium vesticola TaxID=314040 RepID=A0AA40JZY9_9PEZI|nr:hypothetical protein B0T18DRAFT_223408 [Schizothecium vesticola]